MQIFTFASPLFMMKMIETRITTIYVGDNEVQHMFYTPIQSYTQCDIIDEQTLFAISHVKTIGLSIYR